MTHTCDKWLCRTCGKYFPEGMEHGCTDRRMKEALTSLDTVSYDLTEYVNKEINDGIKRSLKNLGKDPDLLERQIKEQLAANEKLSALLKESQDSELLAMRNNEKLRAQVAMLREALEDAIAGFRHLDVFPDAKPKQVVKYMQEKSEAALAKLEQDEEV